MLKKLWNWIQLYLSIQDALAWGKAIFPLLSAGAVGVLGYLEDFPLMYLALGALGAFALAAIGLNALSDWHKRNALLYKFRMTDIGFRWDTDTRKRDGVITHLQPVFTFDNLGERPLSIKVTKFDWRMENRVPTEAWRVNTYRSEPLSNNYYSGGRADVSGLDFDQGERTGMVSLELFYGPPGRERHVWSRSWNVTIQRTPDPDTDELRVTWRFEEPTSPQPGAQPATTLLPAN